MLRGMVRESTKTTEDTGVSSGFAKEGAAFAVPWPTLKPIVDRGSQSTSGHNQLLNRAHNRVSPARYTIRVHGGGVV